LPRKVLVQKFRRAVVRGVVFIAHLRLLRLDRVDGALLFVIVLHHLVAVLVREEGDDAPVVPLARVEVHLVHGVRASFRHLDHEGVHHVHRLAHRLERLQPALPRVPRRELGRREADAVLPRRADRVDAEAVQHREERRRREGLVEGDGHPLARDAEQRHEVEDRRAVEAVDVRRPQVGVVLALVDPPAVHPQAASRGDHVDLEAVLDRLVRLPAAEPRVHGHLDHLLVVRQRAHDADERHPRDVARVHHRTSLTRIA
jgi:hypothetical protein